MLFDDRVTNGLDAANAKGDQMAWRLAHESQKTRTRVANHIGRAVPMPSNENPDTRNSIRLASGTSLLALRTALRQIEADHTWRLLGHV